MKAIKLNFKLVLPTYIKNIVKQKVNGKWRQFYAYTIISGNFFNK